MTLWVNTLCKIWHCDLYFFTSFLPHLRWGDIRFELVFYILSFQGRLATDIPWEDKHCKLREFERREHFWQPEVSTKRGQINMTVTQIRVRGHSGRAHAHCRPRGNPSTNTCSEWNPRVSQLGVFPRSLIWGNKVFGRRITEVGARVPTGDGLTHC